MTPTGRHCVLFLVLLLLPPLGAQELDVKTIIQKSVEANQRDFDARPEYNNKERDRVANGSKTYLVTFIEGTPYNRLIAVNDKPLSAGQQQQEMRKQQQAVAQRKAESPEQRRARIDKYNQERRRDQQMMAQLTEAFNFTLTGKVKHRGFDVYALKATPRPGYKPPNMNAQVLPGMQGQLWIDQKTFQWVEVTAQVIHPVSIEGFLAEVEPGTRFELEKAPVGNGVWLPSHFTMRSRAKVFYLFNRASSADETYFEYQHLGASQ